LNLCHDLPLAYLYQVFRKVRMQEAPNQDNVGPTDGLQKQVVRIGGASGFWGDSMLGPIQLVESGQIDYLVFDYLAETTMAIMAGMKAKKPELGYATDFVDIAMKSTLAQVLERGIKVIANAGGLNPQGCAVALERLAASMGLSPKIAVILGDDVKSLLKEPLSTESLSTESLNTEPPVLTANAYLGAQPIAAALRKGADIVITGRCVDSAVTLGALIFEFNWQQTDYDLLAAGSLGGHLIECGCQATGGLFTDWKQVPDWANIGYPIIAVTANGNLEVFKPEGTGGLISVPSVAEQLLYEIGDPKNYVLPDVVCDFSEVTIEPAGVGRVKVTGAKGRAPILSYKVSATQINGYRCSGALVIIGHEAQAKAQATAQAIFKRCEAIFTRLGLDPFTSTACAILGAESLYGEHALGAGSREVWLRVSASHNNKNALELFAREIAPAGTSWSVGTTGPGLARPAVTPAIKQFSFFIDKSKVPVRLLFEGIATDLVTLPPAPSDLTCALPLPSTIVPSDWTNALKAIRATDAESVCVPLMRLAFGRSGDKGDISNIGIIARHAELLPLLWLSLTPESVGVYLKHLVKGKVERFALPGINAMNFVLHEALDGGGTASARMDPLGKGMAQILLSMPIVVPPHLVQFIRVGDQNE
jgi:Acyclic terpene utilisation family protein AtuA